RNGAVSTFVDIFVEDINLPQHPIRIGDPKLRLPRIAALHSLLALAHDACGFEPSLNIYQFICGSHAQSGVVDVSADPAGNQRQNERRSRKLKLGVIFTDLCRFGTEKSAVESDGPVKVACIERNVKFDKRSVNSCHRPSAYYHFTAPVETRLRQAQPPTANAHATQQCPTRRLRARALA